ncbi:cache domain-containing protein [Fundidesulfovibrio terrae]|uniref:cache domain-containing protein n=1 Tax=Fundidesulfovibrio terrae TaxID=2922866 RepID=UPI001FAEA3B4|nr:cache domain-containing protein [Fundidesulfovibrio terrae]
MARAHSISKLFSASALVFTACSSLITASIVIVTQYIEFRHNTELYEQEYVQRQQDMLKSELDQVSDIIQFERSTIMSTLKSDLKERIDEASSIATSIYENNKNTLGDEQIKKIILQALGPLSFYDGRGYYWIHDTDHNLVMNRFRPDMIGKSDYDLTDLSGKKIIRSFVRIAGSNGEGYDSYYWNKPGQPIPLTKISYLKLFAPYHWIIGTGEYLEDIETSVQAGIKKRLELFTSSMSSLRIIDFGGTVLFDPSGVYAVGENIVNEKDPTGRYIVLDFLSQGLTPQGGFGSVGLPRERNGPYGNNLFYAKPVPGWGWILVASVPLEHMDEVVFQHRDSLRSSMLKQILMILGALAAVTAVVFVLSTLLSRRVRNEFTVFSSFFRNVSQRGSPIDAGGLTISELRSLAGSANDMNRELHASRFEILRKTRLLEEEVAVRAGAEAELLKARNAFQAILDSMPSVVVAVDDRADVTHWNRTAAQATGLEGPDVAGRPVGKVLPGMEERMDAVRESLEKGVPVLRGKQNFVFRGEPRKIDMLVYPLKDGRVHGAVIRLDDVTEKTSMEEMLIQTEKVMSLGGLAAGMAHEINNPLGGILQSAQVVSRRLDMDNPASAEAARKAGCGVETLRSFLEARTIRELLDGIRQSAKRAATIVSNMLEFSRKSDSGMIPANLNDIVDKSLELCGKDYNLEKRYDFRKIGIERDFDASLPLVLCSPTQIEQVLVNLIRNAAHALSSLGPDASPRIAVRTRREPHFARIDIQDNGPGMDEALRRRIFEPFYSTKQPGEGTGLGLSVSFFIITKNHGGTIHVESEPGKGALFVIRLPIGRE